MTLEQAKKELVRRYKYLYENAAFVLAPYMYEQSEEEYQKSVDSDIKKYGKTLIDKPMIYLNINTLDSVNSIFEEFLLSDKQMEESTLYEIVESNRNNKDYLEKAKKGLELVEKANVDKKYEMFKLRLNIWKILEKVSNYIEEQSGDLTNKKRKLYVLDQYYRIARYQNDGKIYKSGRNLILDESWGGIIIDRKREPFRDKKDTGITSNPFITVIAKAPYHEDNWSIFTENEKQQIYLQYHDELPCDLMTKCELDTSISKHSKLIRPFNTNPCSEYFYVNEQEIFIDSMHRTYQLCPHCGYIVHIPKEILSKGIKQRIVDRCKIDPYLFRKMYLYSELFSLDNKSTKEQRKILKKNSNNI